MKTEKRERNRQRAALRTHIENWQLENLQYYKYGKISAVNFFLKLK